MKKIIICLSLLISLNIHSINANQNKYFFISSNQLPQYIYITLNDSIHIEFIDKNIQIQNTNITIDHIQNTLQKPIDHFIHLDLDALSNDFNIPYQSYNLYKLHDLCSYFKQISNQIDFKILFHLDDYMQSNLSLLDLYDLYPYMKNPTKIYYYAYLTLYIQDSYYLIDSKCILL